MVYLHHLNIIHRDLKPGNILLDEFLNPKIADFCLSKVLYREDEIENSRKHPITSGFKGTYAYCAPEIIAQHKYTKSGDIYAFGMIVYEIITNEIIFEGFNRFKLMQEIMNGYRPEFKFPIPYYYRKLIERCWSGDCSKRPSFNEIDELLESNPAFLTSNVDKDEYFDYISFIKERLPSNKLLNQSDKIDNKSITYFKIGNVIDSYTFYNCNRLVKITIPSSINKIMKCAFSGCSSLESIIIPEATTIIGCESFKNCSSLEEITIPSHVTLIGDNAFNGCFSIKSVTFLSSMTYINEGTFKGCSSLKEITLPSSLTIINDNIFNGCSLLEKIFIPNSIKSIGENEFYGCSSLEEITLTSCLTKIKENAFCNCSKLAKILIPSSVDLIEANAFKGCSSLKEIKILSNSLKKIDESTFSGCSSLVEIEIPSSVNKLFLGSFAGCSSLNTIEIPPSVNLIESFKEFFIKYL